jgi:hypothetical protein
MSGEVEHGAFGERVVELLLAYEGWTNIVLHPFAYGHRLDLLAEHVDFGPTLFEVKVWRDPKAVGTDNVKKAIADAYDLTAAGETRPYVLVLSHQLDNLHRVMLGRAILSDACAMVAVRVLALVPFDVDAR